MNIIEIIHLMIKKINKYKLHFDEKRFLNGMNKKLYTYELISNKMKKPKEHIKLRILEIVKRKKKTTICHHHIETFPQCPRFLHRLPDEVRNFRSYSGG